MKVMKEFLALQCFDCILFVWSYSLFHELVVPMFPDESPQLQPILLQTKSDACHQTSTALPPTIQSDHLSNRGHRDPEHSNTHWPVLVYVAKLKALTRLIA